MASSDSCGSHPVAATCAVALVLLAGTLQGCATSSSKPKEPTDKSTITLSNGVTMPLVAAGTWQYNDSVAEQEVVAALKAGFKHIDTASDYGNQVGVGKGLLASGVKRKDVFITSKVPGCGIEGIGKEDCYNNTLNAIKEDVKQLGHAGFDIGYLDLLLIHFPPCMPGNGTASNPAATICHKEGTGCTAAGNCKAIADQWRAVETAYKQKLVRSVGVSNYCSACFACVGNTTLMPMVNQVQMHVGMGPDPQGFVSFAKKNKMVLMAWSPLGSGGHGSPAIFSGNLTTGIAKAHGVSTAQVALKWLAQHGIAIATKSDNPKHLQEDISLFDWDLTDKEMKSLDAADFGRKGEWSTPSFMCNDPDPQPKQPEFMVLA